MPILVKNLWEGLGVIALPTPTSSTLQGVDWDFADAPANTGIHAIHPYPAKFIPQIPHQLIQKFPPPPSTAVLDPFCGSGTTLVEATGLGFEAWGVDLNPLACLIAQVKTTPLSTALASVCHTILCCAHARIEAGEVKIPPIPRLDHWFQSQVQVALAALITEINAVTSPSVRAALQVAFSSLIVRVSNQESDTRYAAIQKEVSIPYVFDQFRKAVLTLERALLSVDDTLFVQRGKATILQANILSLRSEALPCPIGLVITSPPYPNAYEYWLYHKYRMYWLGMDPLAVRAQEIGSRPHYFTKHPQTEHDFERQMGDCFALLAQVMVKGAKACFLVGRSIIHGRTIDNVAILRNAACPHGFTLLEVIERRIPPSRKTFNPAHSKIEREHLVIFTR